MIFHARWIFITPSLRIPQVSELLCDILFSRILCTWGTLIVLNTLRKVEDHDNRVRWIYLTTVLNMGESRMYAKTKTTTPQLSEWLYKTSTSIMLEIASGLLETAAFPLTLPAFCMYNNNNNIYFQIHIHNKNRQSKKRVHIIAT